jgi:hypothetical protein
MPEFIEIGKVLWRFSRRTDMKPAEGFRNIHGAKVPRATLTDAEHRHEATPGITPKLPAGRAPDSFATCMVTVVSSV